jgi:hypothetical protein
VEPGRTCWDAVVSGSVVGTGSSRARRTMFSFRLEVRVVLLLGARVTPFDPPFVERLRLSMHRHV